MRTQTMTHSLTLLIFVCGHGGGACVTGAWLWGRGIVSRAWFGMGLVKGRGSFHNNCLNSCWYVWLFYYEQEEAANASSLLLLTPPGHFQALTFCSCQIPPPKYKDLPTPRREKKCFETWRRCRRRKTLTRSKMKTFALCK